MTLRAHVAKAVVDALVRAAVWLMRAEELPPLRLPPPPQPRPLACACLQCREERLGRLFVLDAFLARALGTCRWVGHDVDLRWKQ